MSFSYGKAFMLLSAAKYDPNRVEDKLGDMCGVLYAEEPEYLI